MGVVNEPIEDGVGVPFLDGDLPGEDGRAARLALLEDLVEVTTGACVERVEVWLDAGEAA